MSEDNIKIYNPSDDERKSRDWVYSNFTVMWDNNRRSYRQFNDKTLQQYIDDGRKATNIMSKPRDDGRSNVKSSSPLNKLMAILAKVAGNRPDIKVTATTTFNIIDTLRGKVIGDLYDFTQDNMERNTSADVEFFVESFNTVTDGTGIVYEAFKGQTRKVKDITNYNPDNGDVEFEEREVKDDSVHAVDVMPEDFFVWNAYVSGIQDQPRISWRSVVNKGHFKEEFGKFKNTKYVLDRSAVSEYHSEDAYYKDRWEERVENDQVEVIRMYDRMNDRMVIVANGVILQDSPLPWQHKKYPFAKTVNSIFAGGQFFWGMNLWHKIGGDVQIIETLDNLGVEQVKLATNPPQLTTAGNDIEDNMLLSGRVLEVDDVNNFRELQFKSPDQSYYQFIDNKKRDVSLSSVDEVTQGVNVKDVTARGQVIAEENARRLLSLFNMMMEDLVLQRAKLRVPNIIQFILIPGAEFRVEGTDVGGEDGVREINVVGDMAEAETPSQLDMIEKMAELQGLNLERINITPEYLRNAKYAIKIVPESAFQQAKSIAIALQREKTGAIAELFPNIFQSASEIFFKDLLRAYDDDPQKYLDAVKQNTDANAQQLLEMGQGGGQQQPQGITGQMAPEASMAQLTGVES